MKKWTGAIGPMGWVVLGWVAAMLYVLGPRLALNRGLDKIYAFAGFVGSLF